jgi:hypothetical protein
MSLANKNLLKHHQQNFNLEKKFKNNFFLKNS